MSHKPFEEDDPFALVGMVLPGTQDAASLEAMARCFIEEFVRMGWDEAQILVLFQDPFYRGPHAVYRARGSAFIHQLIGEVQREWNGERCMGGPADGPGL